MSEPQEIADLLDGLDAPTPDEVYTAVESWGTRDVLAAVGSVAKAASGGGSVPGSVQTVAMEIQETAGAGTYTASVDIPEGATVGQVWMYALDGPWAADTADLDIADSDGNTYCEAQPLTTELIGGPYTGLGDLSSDDDFLNTNLSGPPDYKVASWFQMVSNSAPGTPYPAGTTITATVTTTGAGGTTGHTRIVVMYHTAPTTTQAVKS